MSEQWRLGDVVRNADDPTDRRAWLYGATADAKDVLPWMDIRGFGWSSTEHLPTNLALLVRHGQPVAAARDELHEAQQAHDARTGIATLVPVAYQVEHCYGAARLIELSRGGWEIKAVYTTTDGSPVYVLQRPSDQTEKDGGS